MLTIACGKGEIRGGAVLDGGNVDARRGVGAGGATSSGGTSTSTGGIGGIANLGGASSTGGAVVVGTSGGATDSGTATPTRDAATSAEPDAGKPCVTAGTELCDDFESGQIDGAKWETPKPSDGVSVVVDREHAHGGNYALHIHGVAGQINNGVLAESATFPAQSNSFYARILAYGTPSFEFGPWANTKAVPSEWVCLELFEDGSDPSTERRKVWVDDRELTELESDSAKAAGTGHPNHEPGMFDHVTVGLWEFHPSPTLTDMWVDDVRVSSEKIGCK
ncbi:MAG TPA: hypothetical protein VH142_06350 [Polyangiaceae bacterium]|nr:hypothetical protein [Polyangiaceae bacterium]